MSVNLGDRVKDTISGLVGVVVGITYCMWQNPSYGIQSKVDEKGKPGKIYWLDEERFEVIEKGAIKGSGVYTESVKLGDAVRDIVTGFEGVAITRTKWLWGCNRVGLQTKIKEGESEMPEVQVFDEGQLQTIEEKVVEAEEPENGGPLDFEPSKDKGSRDK